MKRLLRGAWAGLILPAALTGCGGGGGRTSASVPDHVHAAVAGADQAQILLATHYGLEESSNGGLTWEPDAGLGTEMVAGLVKLPGDYVASLQPMAGMTMPKMTASNMTSPGMSMGPASTPNIGYSTDAGTWTASKGIPVGALVAALAAGPDGTVWASVIGFGLYESGDGGRTWQRELPATVPISDIAVEGANLLFVTPAGLFVTYTTGPIMPGLPQLPQPVNDMAALPGCSTCVVAAMQGGGVAISDDSGVTWSQVSSTPTFDELSAPVGPSAIFGMVPSPADPDHGVWRSTDDGRTWHRVIDADLIDHLYAAPAAGGAVHLLAFQWGINVFQSTDDGQTWASVSRIGPP